MLLERVPSADFRRVFKTILQGEQLGTPLKDILAMQAKAMRERRIMNAEKLAQEAGTKLLAPCMLIMLAALLIVIGPMVMQIFEAL